jgi:hypothetical protein
MWAECRNLTEIVSLVPAGSTARFKPNARRLEMSIPLDTSSENYRAPEEENKGLKTLELR